jgi:hypothetical protein
MSASAGRQLEHPSDINTPTTVIRLLLFIVFALSFFSAIPEQEPAQDASNSH